MRGNREVLLAGASGQLPFSGEKKGTPATFQAESDPKGELSGVPQTPIESRRASNERHRSPYCAQFNSLKAGRSRVRIFLSMFKNELEMFLELTKLGCINVAYANEDAKQQSQSLRV